MRLSFVFITLLLLAPAHVAARRAARAPDGHASPQPVSLSVAVLDFGEAEEGRRVAEHLAKLLTVAAADAGVRLSARDRGLSGAAARGVGYRGSLNLTRREARDLGAAVGCDFLILGDARTLRRSPSERPPFYEAYASVLVVSARTGRLVAWERPAAEAATAGAAAAALLAALDSHAAARYLAVAAREFAREEHDLSRRATRDEPAALVDFSAEGTEAAEDVREPAPFRRLRPQYTEAAARAEAEATVDAVVDLDEAGEVVRVEIERWAGFGLDEEVEATVRRMHFRPAARDGRPVPSRVLLRYNFRRPPPEKR